MSDGMLALLKKKGFPEQSMLFGLMGDARATKQAMDDVTYECPVKKWAVHSHYFCGNWNGYESGMATALWGIDSTAHLADPNEGRGYGWASQFWVSYFPRNNVEQNSVPLQNRSVIEAWIGAVPGNPKWGVMGTGRCGADFWPVIKDDRGRPTMMLAGYYPEASWGQLHLKNTTTYLLGHGKNGPIPTVRSENLRESVQELEARFYLEKALFDEEAKAMLGDALRTRIREALDERIRANLYLGGRGEPCYIAGWADRTEKLYTLVAEVAAKYNGKTPVPTNPQAELRKPR